MLASLLISVIKKAQPMYCTYVTIFLEKLFHYGKVCLITNIASVNPLTVRFSNRHAL